MITIIQGGPGSGKTYYACRYTIFALMRGEHVYTNAPMIEDKILKYIAEKYSLEVPKGQLHIIEDKDLRQLEKVVGYGTPITVICDESHMQLNARDFAQQSRDLMNWASVSRHYRADLIFISQHRHNIDAQLRRLANQYLFLRDFQKFKMGGLDFRFFPYFRNTVVDVDEKTVLYREWIKKDKGIYKCYDSYNLAVGEMRKSLIAPVIKKKGVVI